MNQGRSRGFTMVELVVVLVVTGIIAATLAVTIRPTVDAYTAVKGRADLTDQADAAMRRIVRDVRSAVPNSLRSSNTQCFELIPAKTGGRYRMGPDTVRDTPTACDTPSNTCAAPLDPTRITQVFDSLSTLSPTPVAGDLVVVNNQNSNDVYDGLNRSVITNIQASPLATQGAHRITINPIQFSAGYDGGRFQIIDNSQKAVFYVCSGTGVDANGNGTGTLHRLKNYGFNASNGSACPSTVGADVLATRVKSCSFLYDPNQGATQQSGFLLMDIEIARNNETAHLSVGAHVNNVP